MNDALLKAADELAEAAEAYRANVEEGDFLSSTRDERLIRALVDFARARADPAGGERPYIVKAHIVEIEYEGDRKEYEVQHIAFATSMEAAEDKVEAYYAAKCLKYLVEYRAGCTAVETIQ